MRGNHMSTRPQRLGKYELQESLGREAMVEAWKALDTQSQQYMTVKLLHPDLQATPDFVTLFKREVGMIASLHNPNIVQIHDFQVISHPQADGSNAYLVKD